MTSAIVDRYGPPEVVRLDEVERPTPTGDQVLIKVHAASVNRADLDGLGPRPGFVRLFFGLRKPKVDRIGLDAAGVVETVGPDVTRFKAGDRVSADLSAFGMGAFAEYACAPERAFQPIPAGMGFDEAAALPHSAILAVQGLRRRDGRTIKPGDKVLIDGASGNVGPFAVQIAKALGADVTGVASTAKLELVRSIGADRVIDYTKVDYTRQAERYDWILDTDSHHSITRVRRALKPNGVYVTLGGTARPIIAALVVGPLISRFSDRWSGLLLWWKPFDPEDLDTVYRLMAAGSVRAIIDRIYQLEEIVTALKHVNDGRARGKVIVHP